jgi:DNA-binding NtrC family response regulator
MLEARHLGLTLSNQEKPAAPFFVNSSGGPESGAPANGFLTLAEIEKRHILAALNHCQGNRTHAAKLLDVSIRTLRNKLHEYNGTAPASPEEKAAVGS